MDDIHHTVNEWQYAVNELNFCSRIKIFSLVLLQMQFANSELFFHLIDILIHETIALLVLTLPISQWL